MSTKIDKSLYSRQLYTIGNDAMELLNNTSILISGMTGLGVEIAKCVILSGVNSVTLHDTGNIRRKELTSNYYAQEEDIGKSRVEIVKNKLASLNPYVNVIIDSDSLTELHFKNHQIIVICDQLPLSQIRNNQMARQYGTKFILATTLGVMGSIFCDFGDEFCINDIDGETPRTGVIIEIKDEKIITSEPHQLYVGDIIKININNEFEKIDEIMRVHDVTTFSLKNTKLSDKMLVNSGFVQIKESNVVKFMTLEESLKNPELLTIISDDFERPKLLHDFYVVLNMFIINKGRFPRSWNKEDSDEILSLMKIESEYHKNIIQKLSYTCSSKLCPVDSIIGSIVAQEVMKASSRKYTPIKQWMYIDFTNIVPDGLSEEELILQNNRYDSQIAIFGNTIQRKIKESNIFIVGAGAIGCELLKNIAMMGVGNITITDMDIIEKSNLNRQFLFGYSDIGKFKSETAKSAILKMNSEININAQQNKVATETINVYNKKFFKNVTCTLTALDNVQARLFVDNLCIENRCPLIDSGTLGTKGNTQVVIPNITESYGSSQDPTEQTIPMCTLKNFPYLIEHCIQYATNLFEGLFVKAPQNYIRYKKNPEEFKKMTPSELSEIVDDILFVHNNSVCHNKECIKIAYTLWHEHFRNQIQHLIVKYPENAVTNENVLFWTGSKRYPKVNKFTNDEINIEFIEATANLWADVFSLKHVNKKQIIQFLNKLKIQTNDIIIDDKQKEQQTIYTTKELIDKLPKIEEMEYNVKCLKFEKDDDTNFHIDFITSVSNLRANNYNITQADKFKTKGIAGKIIPAIITTTSLVSGLVTIELIKIIQGITKIEKYNNSFVNMAIPFFGFSEPKKAKKHRLGDYEYSLWDNMTFNNPILKDLINIIKNKINDENIIIMSITIGQYILFSTMTSETTQKERLEMRLGDIYNKICKQYPSNSFNVSVFIDSDDDIEPIICNIDMV